MTSKDYHDEYHQKHQSDPSFKTLLEQRSQLPVFGYKRPILQAIHENRVIIIKGATGCGKTTQVRVENMQDFPPTAVLITMNVRCELCCTAITGHRTPVQSLMISSQYFTV